MFMSRQVEKTPKTKFRKRQPEEVIDKLRQKQKQKMKPLERKQGFDMWEDEPNDGC